MITNRQTIGLKGQLILAQGKRSGALGLESEQENRQRGNVHKRGNHISDEGDDLLFPGNDILQFRPKGIFSFVHRIPADDFSSASFTQGGVSDRSSRNYAVRLSSRRSPGLKYIGPSGRKNVLPLTCV